MARINSYSFGFMDVDGVAYTTDLIILPSGVVPNWWRKEGHTLLVEDLEPVLKEKPVVLVVGTGYDGRLRVSREVEIVAERAGIRLVVERTLSAWKTFNELKEKRKAGAFHLTC